MSPLCELTDLEWELIRKLRDARLKEPITIMPPPVNVFRCSCGSNIRANTAGVCQRCGGQVPMP